MKRLTDSNQPICEQCVASGKGCNLYECGEEFAQAHCSQYRKLKRLAEYEDAEEQGLLIKLPCKVGDAVYILHRAFKNVVVKCEVTGYTWWGTDKFCVKLYSDECNYGNVLRVSDG